MQRFRLLVLAAALAFSPACKKKNDTGAPPAGSAVGSSDVGSGSATAGSGSAPGSGTTGSAGSDTTGSAAAAGSGSAAPAEDPNADYFEVVAHHEPAKPTDPVRVKFENVKIVKATFDPKKLEGGKATIEVDLASLKTDSAKRDEHLKSESYIAVAKFAKMTIDIANVKKKDDTHYTADATVKLHGQTKKYPVSFEVLEVKDDSVRVRGEQKFSRNDFKVGKPKTGEDELVAPDMFARLQLTLKKT